MIKRESIRVTTASALCLALALVLPFLTGQIQPLGAALAPMHIPILLCGFVAGPAAAAAVGLVAPLLRFVLFGMPPIMPIGVAMAFELAAYGLAAGALYSLLPKKIPYIYVSLLSAMLLGRVVFGVARVLLLNVHDVPYSWELFMGDAFLNAIPGIIVHIILIPLVVIALKRARLMKLS